MKPLELDLQKIKLEGENKEDENYRFRTYLKGVNGKKLDRNVHSLYESISVRIDCTKCGNCCSGLRPSVSKSEISVLAKIGKESVEAFTDKFTEKIEFVSERYLKDIPCDIFQNANALFTIADLRNAGHIRICINRIFLPGY